MIFTQPYSTSYILNLISFSQDSLLHEKEIAMQLKIRKHQNHKLQMTVEMCRRHLNIKLNCFRRSFSRFIFSVKHQSMFCLQFTTHSILTHYIELWHHRGCSSLCVYAIMYGKNQLNFNL